MSRPFLLLSCFASVTHQLPQNLAVTGADPPLEEALSETAAAADEAAVYSNLRSFMESKGMQDAHRLAVHDVGDPPRRGMILTEDVEARSKVITVPVSELLTSQGEEVTAAVGDLVSCCNKQVASPFLHWTPHDKGQPYTQRVLSLYMMYQKQLGSASPWAAYITTLPTNFTVLEDFDEQALHLLDALQIGAHAVHLLNISHREFRLVQNAVARCDSSFPEFAWADWHWARNVINTRAFNYDMEGGGQDICMVPFVDLANHKNTTTTFFNAAGNFIVYTFQNMKKGEEFFISYGDNLDNNHLIEYYGFTIDNNTAHVPSDCKDEGCECVRQHLGMFDTTLEADTALLKKSMLQFDQKNALRLRVEQRQILLEQLNQKGC